jgi:phenylalanyl-tRNA synthetase beta chain
MHPLSVFKTNHTKTSVRSDTKLVRLPALLSRLPVGKQCTLPAAELMQIYKSDKHLSQYLLIISSEHGKITLETRNVFVNTTATDDTKLHIVIIWWRVCFPGYCAEPFTCIVLFWACGLIRGIEDLFLGSSLARSSFLMVRRAYILISLLTP